MPYPSDSLYPSSSSLADLTAGDLVQEALDHGFSDSRYRSYMLRWINEAQRRICLEADIRIELSGEEYTTTSGVQMVYLPEGFARVVSLSDTDDQTVIPSIELHDFDDLPTSSGKPYAYVIIGSYLAFYPTPDDAYNLLLRYYRLPADLTSSSDIPEIAPQYQHLLVRYAVMRAYQRENDYAAAQFTQELFETDLQKLIGQAQYDTADSPKQIPGSYSYHDYGPRFSIP